MTDRQPMTDQQVASLERQLGAAKRLLAAKEARESLAKFISLMMPDPDDPDDPDKTRYQRTPQGDYLCKIIEETVAGKRRRTGVSMPPQHGKTMHLSTMGIAWLVGKDPRSPIIIATYNEIRAGELGEELLSVLKSPTYRQVFPEVELSQGSKSKTAMRTTLGGRIVFTGKGGTITGRSAKYFIIDDPIKDDEEAQSDDLREKLWKWFFSVAYSRGSNKTSIIILHCLTGDTPVTMADGTRKPLRSVVPGERVLAWKGGEQVYRMVSAVVPQGEDDILEMKTGNHTVRGNARHPFLVETEGGPQWKTLGDIVKGDLVHCTGPERHSRKGKLTEREAWLLGFMFGDGWVTIRDTVQRGRGQYTTRSGEKRVYAENTYPRRGYVTCVAAGVREGRNIELLNAFGDIFGVLPKRTKHGYYRTERAAVGRWFAERGLVGGAHTKQLPDWLFSEPLAVRRAFVHGFSEADGTVDKKGQTTIAGANAALIADLRHLARSTGIRVSNLHSWSGRVQPPNSPAPVDTTIHSFCYGSKQLSAPFDLVRVRSIKPAGREEVFDISVEDAECFVADGLVAHNTRWHEDDLLGRLCDQDHPERNGRFRGISGDWNYINLPGVVTDPKQAQDLGLTLKRPLAEHVIEQFGEKPMAALWEAERDLDHFAQWRRGDARTFDALVMGKPSPDEGVYFLDEWLVEYEPHELPDLKDLRIFGASDHAVSEKQGRDYTVLGCVGVDEDDTIWVLPDLVWERMETDRTVEELVQLFRIRRPQVWWMENELISKSFGPFLKQRMMEERVYVTLSPATPSKDKQTRARSIQGRMAMKKVRFPRSAPWWGRARSQLLRFPNAANDDFVDFLSHIGLGLLRLHGPGEAVEVANSNVVPTGSIEWILRSAKRRAERKQRDAANAGW